jgi:altronate hydrolase
MENGTREPQKHRRSEAVPLQELAVHLHPRDDVAIAKVDLRPGTVLTLEPAPAHPADAHVTMRQLVHGGHKIALRKIAAGEAVHRYGQIIGFATHPILPGEHVHTHNLEARPFARRPAFDPTIEQTAHVPEDERRTFLGYHRADGRVGTRNHIAIIPTANCSASASRKIARAFTAERLAAYPDLDGVVAFTHHAGCCNCAGSADTAILQRVLAGIARHPNVGGYILVGLGCEVNQIDDLVREHHLRLGDGEAPVGLVIQELGGIRRTVEAGIAAVEEMLPRVAAAQRTPQPISELVLALQCGGSDSWSGVTANPVVGMVADEVVRQGGTVVLSETPEIYGAEHLLAGRAISPAVREKLMAKIGWWEAHVARLGLTIDNNPSPGNKAGGLTTIYEKSLGCVAKAGTTPLMDVYDHAERVTARGLAFMDGPGYDPVSVTGQVAGGCNLVLFTTGRGSVAGFKPAPVIKISTNSALHRRMREDIDLDAGRVLEGASGDKVAGELLELATTVASGQPSKSEAQDVGEDEFVVWDLGGTL